MYCEPYADLVYLFFSSYAPQLLYYSHVPAIVVSLLLSAFILSQNRNDLAAWLLGGISVLFSLWAIMDLLIWTQTDSRLIMFLWSHWFIFFGLLFALSFYFLYAFTTKRDLGLRHKLLLFVPLLPILALSSTNLNIQYFDVANCNAVESVYLLAYTYGLSFLILCAIIALGVRRIVNASKTERARVLLAVIGILLFLLSFSLATFIASIANLFQGSPDTFELEQYGYIGMTVFIAFLTYTVVRYRAFNVGLLAAQALIIALVILVGSQLTFVRSLTNQILTAIALVLTGIIGITLIRSVQREILQRQHIEKLAGELEKANERQVILIHFISHQIKGFVSKSRNIFAMMLEGEYGQITPEMKPILEEGLRSDTQGVNTIQDILNASNIKSGKVTYNMQAFDLKALIDEIVANLRKNAGAKGLVLNVQTGSESLIYTGDRGQLTNAFKNLIDNSIKYTPQGEVNVSLTKCERIVHFEINDTGVGISPEDMQNLFTEGGHGKDSAKINVESTGFGLYIVKNIVEAHKGKVWAESAGPDKGSRFVVELPG